MSLIGIENEHEFYSQYFLDEQLSATLADKVKEGKAKEKNSKEEWDKAKATGLPLPERWRAPWNRLSGAAAELRRAINEAETSSDHERFDSERNVIEQLAHLLDLPISDSPVKTLSSGLRLPLIGEIKTPTGAPYLWLLHASVLGGKEDTDGSVQPDNDTDPLELCIGAVQFSETFESPQEAKKFEHKNWRNILSGAIFNEPTAPRWVILCGLSQWILLDRAKFAQRRLLRFQWKDILQRLEPAVLQTAALMLNRAAFQTENEQCYLEFLDDGSYKHAHSVSDDLKYALRESIELLGNEAARQLRAKAVQSKTGIFSGKNRLHAADLSDECLRYMYRLLFLFFVESRPELNYAPVNDEAYLAGYSLESLRDLELIPLMNETERNGSYLHESIGRLFKFFEGGTPTADGLGYANAHANAFTIERLPSTLFDPTKMPLLKNVVFPNYILQRVIELMSLSKPAKGKKGRSRGRISYAHLGLNQLGAVYESLLSYRGFFAKETLYEVKKAATKEVDPLKPAYFVTEAELADYTEDERVYDKDPDTGDKVLRRYEKGSFIYRMAGSSQKDSASYYTPEVLTKCLVEEALNELKKQQLDSLPNDRSRAESILHWRICEPAMGSAAFLNEAVNQVAELYMHYAMRADDAKPLTQVEYSHELQRVKTFLADRNIYGVDLNPVAVELGEVSLWLNSLSDKDYIPWFGLQLHCGNSLIGCRREAYWGKDLNSNDPCPHAVGPEGLQPGEIWHFLVPLKDMSKYNDKIVAELEPEAVEKLNQWRKNFTKKFTDTDIDKLEILSQQIEVLWQTWAQKLHDLDAKTTDPYSIYGHEELSKAKLPYEAKMDLLEMARHGDGTLASGELPRLKLVMDYWCALWLWPLKEVDKLPSREEYLQQITTILSGLVETTVINQSAKESNSSATSGTQFSLWSEYQQGDLFAEHEVADMQAAEGDAPNWVKRKKNLEARFPAIAVVNDLADRERFFHWPLRFASIFLPQHGERAGFDLTLGNPPWKVSSWKASDILGNKNPKYLIHDSEYNAANIREVLLGLRDRDASGRSLFERSPDLYAEWLTAYESNVGAKDFFNSLLTYPLLKGCQADLFKFFLPTVWRHSTPDGVQGLLHPDTIYTETHGDTLRYEAYHRVRKHYTFINKTKLFKNVHDETEFAINIYGTKQDDVQFESISNLYAPKTIALCRLPNPHPVEGKTGENGTWNTQGHPDRILWYTPKTLATVARIFGGTAENPLLPSIYASQFLSILDERFSPCPRRIEDYGNALTFSRCWDEANAQKDGTIQALGNKATFFPASPETAIFNSPHFTVGSACFKSLDNPYSNNNLSTKIDITIIPDNYLPRVQYLPKVSADEYRLRTDKVSWDPDRHDKNGNLIYLGTPAYNFFRVGYRRRVGSDSDRTLTSGILPKFICHVDTVASIVFRNVNEVPLIAGYFAALPIDFYIRQQNKGDLWPQVINSIPLPNFGAYEQAIRTRALCLNCLTSWYKELWEDQFVTEMTEDTWSQTHAGLNSNFFANLTSLWQRNNALRSDLERRQALVELDVLVALALNLPLKELLTIYRLGFRILVDNENNTWYDQKGRIVSAKTSSSNKSLRGAIMPWKKKTDNGETYAINGSVQPKGLGFEDIKNMTSGTVQRTFMDDTLPGGPTERTVTYYAPFFKMNREEDYARAWDHFSKLAAHQN